MLWTDGCSLWIQYILCCQLATQLYLRTRSRFDRGRMKNRLPVIETTDQRTWCIDVDNVFVADRMWFPYIKVSIFDDVISPFDVRCLKIFITRDRMKNKNILPTRKQEIPRITNDRTNWKGHTWRVAADAHNDRSEFHKPFPFFTFLILYSASRWKYNSKYRIGWYIFATYYYRDRNVVLTTADVCVE